MPRWAVVLARSHFSMIHFSSFERDYSLSKGDMTLEKGFSSQHSKDVQLHSSLGSLTCSNWGHHLIVVEQFARLSDP